MNPPNDDYFTPFMARFDNNNNEQLIPEANDQSTSYYCPLWQHYPLQTVVPINFNMLSLDEYFHLSLLEQLSSKEYDGLPIEFDIPSSSSENHFPFAGPEIQFVRVSAVGEDIGILQGLFIEMYTSSAPSTPPAGTTTTSSPSSQEGAQQQVPDASTPQDATATLSPSSSFNTAPNIPMPTLAASGATSARWNTIAPTTVLVWPIICCFIILIRSSWKC